MCGRYTFQPTEAFYRRFNTANRLDGLVARYNIAPGAAGARDHVPKPKPGGAHALGPHPSLGQGRKVGL
jgi:hypothetical protein